MKCWLCVCVCVCESFFVHTNSMNTITCTIFELIFILIRLCKFPHFTVRCKIHTPEFIGSRLASHSIRGMRYPSVLIVRAHMHIVALGNGAGRFISVHQYFHPTKFTFIHGNGWCTLSYTQCTTTTNIHVYVCDNKHT